METMKRQGLASMVWLTVALFMTGSSLYGSAYTNSTTVFVPNDGDSPYTLAAIAENIGDINVFSYDAASHIAVCALNLSISGTLYIGKTDGSGNYNAGGNEEKLKMKDSTVHVITIYSNGTLLARGTQGTSGERRTSTDTLANEITTTTQTYPYTFRIVSHSGGLIKLYDTKVSWAGSGFWVYSDYDIERCQFYAYGHYAYGVEFDAVNATIKTFRDNYIGYTTANNRSALCWRSGTGGVPKGNVDIINCEFENDLIDYYAIGVRIIDCKFNSSNVATIVSTAIYPSRMEYRNCQFSADRRIAFVGANANSWLTCTFYLGGHIVKKQKPGLNVDLGDNDVIIEEKSSPTNQAAIYKFTGGSWSSGTNRASTGTDATGWTPSPTNEGAILLTEMTVTYPSSIVSNQYYYYNLKITNCPRGYFSYDYYRDCGSNYVTSISNAVGAGDKCMGPNWFRSNSAVPNPEPLINEPPTNGTWHIGMAPIIPSGIIVTIH
ncbi:MAG: hypothetical protein PHW60_03840 [Kiritimatiellae bacterium]|nr:hypothetical protein [Kiritimatiellia bacterium]